MNMSAAVSTMSASLSKLLVSFEDNYFLGFLAGVAVTGIIQSSSAVVGILQSIASSVGVSFCGVFAVIIGVNIGDCLTRVCLVHVIYNVCAAVMIFCAIGILRATGIIGDDLWFRQLNSGGVANIHGLFRLLPAVLLLPLSGLFADLAEKIAPDKPQDAEDADIERNLRELDMHLITNPGLALAESEHLIGHMSEVSFKNYNAAVKQLFNYKSSRNEKISHREDLLDRMADGSNQYIIAVSPYVKRPVDNHTQNFQLRALVAFERIGDLSVNMNESAGKMNSGGFTFSDIATKELLIVTDACRDILNTTVQAYNANSIILARKVEPLEEVIDELIEELRNHHVYRMTHNLCDAFKGIEFQNVLNYLVNGREHQYINDLHNSEDAEYLADFNTNYEIYFGRLKAQAIADGSSPLNSSAPGGQSDRLTDS